jgi:Zn-dependent peptidase ImmA (M78 family)
MKIEFNIERVKYLLALFRMSEEELLSMLNSGRVKPLAKKDIFAKTMELSLLKKVGAVFNKEISFFMDYSDLNCTRSNSIFFRRDKFETNLNMESKRVVCKYEELKHTLNAYLKLADIKFPRLLPSFSTEDSAREVAVAMHDELYPEEIRDKKTFLKAFINKLADKNVFVFEFVETRNKKEKANVDGFFIEPNVIVLKRNQSSFSREIFSLAHELGHCLLNKEEVETIDLAEKKDDSENDVEKWCNDFAFYFLAGEWAMRLDDVTVVDKSNDYCNELIKDLSEKTKLSSLAIYTRLFIDRKLTYSLYETVKFDLINNYKKRQEENKLKQTNNTGQGSSPKPIISNLYRDALQCAYYKGVINEMEFCKNLNIKPDHIQKFLS